MQSDPSSSSVRPEKITETDTVTVSAPSSFIRAFQAEARTRYGMKGVSRASREAFEEWMTKRGVSFNGSANDSQAAIDLEACREARKRGIDPLVALAGAVNAKVEEEAAATALPATAV